MEINEILNRWREDSQINKSKLDDESIKLAEMHSQYMDIFMTEKYKLIDMENAFKIIKADRLAWYRGTLPEDDIKKYGWGFQPQKLINDHIKSYMEGDKILINYYISLEKQREKVNLLQKLIETVKDRGFQIKNAIEWVKYTNGF